MPAAPAVDPSKGETTMTRSRIRTLAGTALLAMTIGLAAPASVAATFPNHPITLVVGFSPGGSSDILARLVAQHLSASLGQQVIVANKPGAGATIATASVAAAPADGHTLLFVTSGHAGSGALYAKLSYDPIRSFTPVVLVGTSPVVVVAPAKAPFSDLKGLVAAARANPGKLNYAAGGGGATVTALAAEYLKRDTNIAMQNIPYKGSGPALIALIAGEVDAGFDIPSSALPHLKSGKLRALAVTSRQRSSVLPDVPTVIEQGVPEFDVVGWFGVLAPAATPADVVARLNREIAAVLQRPDVRERLASLGVEPGGGTASAFGALIDADTKRAHEAIRRLGLAAK